MLLCNTAIDDFMCSQRRRLMETMSVSCKASNNRKQSKDPQGQALMMWRVERLNHSESNFDLHLNTNRNAFIWLFVMYKIYY